MSKFFQDLPDADELERLAPLTRRVKLKVKPPVLSTERGCDTCPLKYTWRTLSTPKMPMSGAKDADILVIGNNPTEYDDTKGDHFRDTYGKLLRQAIPSRHKDRIAFTHLSRCHVPIGPKVKIPRQAFHNCSEYLEDDIRHSGIKFIIGLGQDVINFFWTNTKVNQIHFIHGLKFVVDIGGRLFWFLPIYDIKTVKKDRYDRPPERLAEYIVTQAEIKEFFKQVDRLPKPTMVKVDPKVVRMPQSYAEAIEYIDAMSEPVGLDFEGNRLKPYMHGAKMLSAAMSDGKTTIAFSINHSGHINSWGLKAVEYMVTRKVWVAHSAAMEYIWLRHFLSGAKLKPFHDTQALGRIAYNRASATSLAAMTRIQLGVDFKLLGDLVVTKLDDYPVEEVLEYNGLDALGCRLVFDTLYDKVIKEQPTNYARLNEATEATCEMELMGIPINQEEVQKLRKIWLDIVREAERKALNVPEVQAWEAVNEKDFMISSNAQIAEVLTQFAHIRLPKTEVGNYMTGEDILKEHAGSHPLVVHVLDHRESSRQISTYIDPCASVPILFPDNMLHPGYTVNRTRTFRLSSEDPNIQNFPNRRHKAIRRMVPAPKGCVIVPMDYGQVEARVIAMATKDKYLINSILSGEDIHSFWLNKLLNIYPEYLDRLADKTNETDPKLIRKGGRGIIKTDFVFASFYGSTPQSCSNKTGVPLPHMVEMANELWRTHTGVKVWMKQQRAIYEETGSITGLTGHIRHEAIQGGNEVINTPIQSVAGDIMVDAMNELSRLSREEKDPYLHPRMSIHDDLTFFLPDNDRDLEAYMMRIMEIMVKVRYQWQIVPLMIEAKIGKNWADLSELFNYTGDYVR